MSDLLKDLMDQGCITPLSYYFARFVTRGNGTRIDSLLGLTAALLSQRNQAGDVCLDLARHAEQPLFESSADNPLNIPLAPTLDRWAAGLLAHEWVGEPGEAKPLILDRERLYLGKYWALEDTVAQSLTERLAPIERLDETRLGEGLARLFPGTPDDGVDWQKVAAAIAVSRRFAVISGGPGTGKTTTVVKVLTLLLEQQPAMRIALCAPTGKAAARLTESIRGGKQRLDAAPEVIARIPEKASTIHRLLGARPNEVFQHGPDSPLLIDCLVMDEASMVDLPLMARLVGALRRGTRLILLGDRDQLASVEAGAVLGDITGHGVDIRFSRSQSGFLERVDAVAAGDLPAASGQPAIADAIGLLRTSYRFDDRSGIGRLASLINASSGREAHRLLTAGGNTDIAWIDGPAEGLHPDAIDWAVERYRLYLEETDIAGALAAFERVRVLAALRSGPHGVDQLNAVIARRLRARGLIQAGPEYPGKPIMISANSYELGLFNGDIGLLWVNQDGDLRAYFRSSEGELRDFPVRRLPDHQDAFVLTVHKSQGSEFDDVLIVLPCEASPVLTRELIYTGVTRAREQLTLQGASEAFIRGCQARVQRASGLAARLGW